MAVSGEIVSFDESLEEDLASNDPYIRQTAVAALGFVYAKRIEEAKYVDFSYRKMDHSLLNKILDDNDDDENVISQALT